MNTPTSPSNLDSTKGAKTQTTKYGIRSTNVIWGHHFEPVDAIILVDDEKIFDVILVSETPADKLQQINNEWEIENYGNLCIFPGIIDSNVHLHTNYDNEWDNVVTSTKLAAAGGVTTIIDNSIMTKPFENAQEYLQILQEKIQSLKSNSKVDFGIFGLLEPKTQEYVQEMVDVGVMGLKCYLFSCLQNGIGNIEPEYIGPLMEYLNEYFPHLLLAFHPEVATEREVYLSSPCRMSKLEDRLDMNFEIKSLGLGAGGNKGAYLEEFNKSATNSEGLDDDDDCPTPSLDTPSKLRSKIKRSKEKTEINQIVHFELMSYGYEESKIDMENMSSDSDIELPDSLNQSPMAKSNKSTPKNRESKLLSAKPAKKSIFKNGEIKEVDSNENTPISGQNAKSQFAAVRRSIFASRFNNSSKDDDNEPEHELDDIQEDSSKSPVKTRFHEDDSDLEEPKNDNAVPQDMSPSRRERTSMLSNKKNRSSSLVIAFSSKVSKLLEDDRQKELLTADNLDTAGTKSPNNQTHDREPETVDEINKLSGSSRNILGSGLTDHKTEDSASEMTDSTRKLFLNLSNDPEKLDRGLSPGKQLSPSRQNIFSPDFINNSQDANNTSFNSSPCESSDHVSGRSNLLLRRIVRKSSANLPSTGNSLGKPSLSVPPRNFKIVNNLETVKSPNPTNIGEQKFNICYRVFLANRATNWEENGVMTILTAYKPEFKLRIIIQNLALASSFLKIREKKKKEPQHSETIYGDTGSAYLFFNEKAVKKTETKYKATPAFRDKENRKLLVENFRLGGIDLVTSYHLYVPPKYKEVDGGNFRRAFGGFDSIGFNLQSLWTTLYVFYKKNNNKFAQEPFYKKKMVDDLLCKIAKALCSNPAKMLKIDDRKGVIEKGKDADFVIWDPYGRINNQNLHPNHIFSRRILYGLVHKTYLRGKVIYDKENGLESVGGQQQAKFLAPLVPTV